MMVSPKSILILGSGGREHAIAYRCKKDKTTESVYVMPGNPGMTKFHQINIISGDPGNIDTLLKTITEYNIELVIIGPEALLDKGVADKLRDNDIPVVGPGVEGSRLESSKAFSKDFMFKHNIPTAGYKNFNNSQSAKDSIVSGEFSSNPVVKASELAGGKGVFVCQNHEEAFDAIDNIFHNESFSVNSSEIVIEECLTGKELSAFALFDENSYQYLGHASDFKRLLDEDRGPNTGGMGTWTPDDFPSDKIKAEISKQVFDRVLQGLKTEGIIYRGVLFAGLMINNDDINVIEFNVRFGDPETQSILPLLEGNFSASLMECALGKIGQSDQHKLRMSESLKAVHIVKVSKNYPSLDGTPMLLNQELFIDSNIKIDDQLQYFFAGVKDKDEKVINSGGRVVGVTAIAPTAEEARKKAYKNINAINFEGQFYRKDIAKK